MATKKRVDDERGPRAPTKKRTVRRAPGPAHEARREGAAKGDRPAPRAPARRAPSPRIRASHGAAPDAPATRPRRPLRALPADVGRPKPPLKAGAGSGIPALKPKGAGLRKAPLAGPKRDKPVARARPVEALEGPSSEARELALALAGAAIDKKAIGIEILDVTGKVDYADFLVVMTGRSDRHVHSIATGIEEEMRRKKHAPLSVEGLSAATWVLIDFGDVVVHVFQEDARALYDIEGLWIDAGRVPVPPHEVPETAPRASGRPDAGPPLAGD